VITFYNRLYSTHCTDAMPTKWWPAWNGLGS